jgi:hypothetical protein
VKFFLPIAFLVFINNRLLSQFFKTDLVNYSIGINYRQSAIDIQNHPYSSSNKDYFYDSKFWQVPSLYSSINYKLKNSYLSFENYIRYNHLYFTDKVKPYATLRNTYRNEVKKMKYDVFLNYAIIKKLKKDINLNFKFGIGFSNLNTKYDVTYYDTVVSTGIIYPNNYKGTFAQLTPKFELEVINNRLGASSEVLLVEGENRIGLWALWLGFKVFYILHKKN